jgi:hypothetical protein
MMLDLIISTIAFFVAVFYINRYLDDQGMNKGMSRSMLVFLIASVVSICVPMAVDFASEEIGGHKKSAGADALQGNEVSQLLKDLSALQGR